MTNDTPRRAPLRTARAATLTMAIAAATLAACALLPGGAAPDIDGRTFLSTAVTEDGVDRPLVADARIRLIFEDGRIGASVGCNIMGGEYRIEGGRLNVEGGAMTEMGCDPERHAQDDWLFGFLGARPAISLSGTDLTLAVDETVIRLTDREVAEPDLPLSGTLWTVDGVIDGDAVSSVPEGVVATIRIDDAGQLAVQTGCNSGGGPATIDEAAATIDVGDLILTERACPGPEGAMEDAVLAVLADGPISYTIEAQTLTLQAGDQGLTFKGG